MLLLFFFKQKTAYESRISDWSSDVCSSDLAAAATTGIARIEGQGARRAAGKPRRVLALAGSCIRGADADRLVVGRASWKGRPFVWWSSRPGRHVRCRRPGRSRRERAHANDRTRIVRARISRLASDDAQDRLGGRGCLMEKIGRAHA